MATTTPKEIMSWTSRRRIRSGVFGSTQNPVAQEVRNASQERMFYQGQAVVPFLHQGDASVNLIRKLHRLSPTNGSCINNIVDFVVGGQFDVGRKKRKGWRAPKESQPISQVEWDRFADFTEAVCGQELDEVHAEARLYFLNRYMYGNAYMEIKIVPTTGGQHLVFFHNQDVDRILYRADDEDTIDEEGKTVLISPHWYDQRSDGKAPEAVAVYPNFTEDEDGTKRTIYHSKRDQEGRQWYGEPRWINNLYHSYAEIQRGEYAVEAYANDFTGRVFIETYDDAMGADLLDDYTQDAEDYSEGAGSISVESMLFESRLRQLFTNRGTEKRRILYRSAPVEAKQSTVHEFKPNTDHDYHETMSQLDERKIVMAHNWDQALLGGHIPGKLGKGQEFEQAYVNKFTQVIEPYMAITIEPFNLGLSLVTKENDSKEQQELVSQYSLKFGNIYQNLLEAKKNQDAGTNQAPGTRPRAEQVEELNDEDEIDTDE